MLLYLEVTNKKNSADCASCWTSRRQSCEYIWKSDSSAYKCAWFYFAAGTKQINQAGAYSRGQYFSSQKGLISVVEMHED